MKKIFHSKKFFGAVSGAVIIFAAIAVLELPFQNLKIAGFGLFAAGLASVILPWIKK